jgi:prepilin-type N-terminal cleavage/methylation domain-containing protein
MFTCRVRADVESTDRRRAPFVRTTGGDQGFSLLEILIGLTLLVLVAIAVLPAIRTATRVSSVSDTQAKTSAVLGNAVDRITNFGWLPCPETDADGGYLAKARNASASVSWPASTITITDIRYWDSTSGTWTDVNPIPLADCTNTQTSWSKEKTLQMITVSVTSPEDSITNAIDVVMGDIRDDEVRDAT